MIATIENMNDHSVHVPVLADDVVDQLAPAPGATVVDCTFGAGGHARVIAERIGSDGELIAIDRDPDAAERFERFAADARCRTRFIRADFADGLEALLAEGVRAESVLLDLGVSSPQIDSRERGFSYSYDAPLDMRMDTAQTLTAAEVVNEWPEARLAEIFKTYGEEKNARSVAREVVARRPLKSTSELAEAIRAGMPPAARFGRGHPAKRSFQAIRIAVNGEIESLEASLPLAWELLAPRGRLAVISFHSLEDRRVKQFFAGLARGCTCPPELPVCVCGHEPEALLLTRKPVMPNESEIGANPRAGSARLRCAMKLNQDHPEEG